MSTHPVFAVPNFQCAKCLSVMYFHRALHDDQPAPYATARCGKCGVSVKIPLTRLDCEAIGIVQSYSSL